jgi:hypothetical protein
MQMNNASAQQLQLPRVIILLLGPRSPPTPEMPQHPCVNTNPERVQPLSAAARELIQ